jgi:hypothetical protein
MQGRKTFLRRNLHLSCFFSDFTPLSNIMGSNKQSSECMNMPVTTAPTLKAKEGEMKSVEIFYS